MIACSAGKRRGGKQKEQVEGKQREQVEGKREQGRESRGRKEASRANGGGGGQGKQERESEGWSRGEEGGASMRRGTRKLNRR